MKTAPAPPINPTPPGDETPWQCWRADIGRYTGKMTKNPVRRLYYLLSEETVWAISVYRLTQAIVRVRVPVLGPLLRLTVLPLRKITRLLSGVDISPAVRIGPGLFIAHAGAVHVHEAVVFGPNCNLPHDLTVGVGGTGRRRGVPRIGQCVFISAGAKIYGDIEIGDYVTIGPNAVVTRSIPSCSVVGGIPGRVVARTTELAVKKLIFGQDYAEETVGAPTPLPETISSKDPECTTGSKS
jgi:serine O-acetyltransferase